MTSKDRVKEAKAKIQHCLIQLKKYSKDNIKEEGESTKQKNNSINHGPVELLLKSLLAQQLNIIENQNKRFTEYQKIIDQLITKNKKLNHEVRKYRSKEKEYKIRNNIEKITRGTSPIGKYDTVYNDTQTPFLHQPDQQDLQSVAYKRKICVRKSKQPETKVKSPVNISGENKFLQNEKLTPRKTRSSVTQNDSIDDDYHCTSIRKSNSDLVNNDTTPINNERYPRLRMNSEENYVCTPDPQFLASPLYTEIIESKSNFDNPGLIEVPSWRKNMIMPCRRPVSAERLEDEVFLRRHSKAEENEKRRKRWDAQKLREETYVEQLKERLAQRKNVKKTSKHGHRKISEDDPDEFLWVDSFHPNPMKAEYIQVSDEVPINIFGIPLSALKEEEFSLPWTENVKLK